jgi:predicted porin
MQKKLIVLAIAALASTSAFADSTTTVYGLVDAAVVNVTGSGLIGGTTAVSGGLAASRLGVKNVEDLDGGLKAVAVAEIGLNSETNAGYSGAARQALLALAGGFGTVATGYLQTTGWDFGVKYNVVGGSAVSPLGNITKAQGFLIGDQATANRAQRAVAYISPNIDGLVVAVNYSSALTAASATATGYGDVATLTTTGPSNITATLVSADYTAGPLAVALVYAGTNAEAFTADTTEYALGLAYTMDAAKITATYQTSKHANSVAVNGTSSNTVYSVGAAVPVGPGTIALSYAGSNIATKTNSNASGYTVAYLQGLSKTTTAYLAYSGMTQGTSSTGVTIANDLIATTAGGNSSILALGLSKKF